MNKLLVFNIDRVKRCFRVAEKKQNTSKECHVDYRCSVRQYSNSSYLHLFLDEKHFCLVPSQGISFIKNQSRMPTLAGSEHLSVGSRPHRTHPFTFRQTMDGTDPSEMGIKTLIPAPTSYLQSNSRTFHNWERRNFPNQNINKRKIGRSRNRTC